MFVLFTVSLYIAIILFAAYVYIIVVWRLVRSLMRLFMA
jgi:hypothetical protein